MRVENIKIRQAAGKLTVMDCFTDRGLALGGHSALPDIDVDYASDRRQEIKEYLEERYNTDGRQRVFSAGTFTTLKLKAALKDVGRVHRVPHSTINYITAILDDNMDWTDLFRVAATNRKVWSFVQTYPEMIEDVRTVMGQPKASSIHASAIIVTPEQRNGRAVECFDFLPIRKMENQLVSEFDGYSVDSIGLLKEDVLATKELSKLSATINLVNGTYGTHHSIESITQDELEDEKTYRMLADGFTQNVFQFSSRGITRFIQDVRPADIEDLIAINALYRPATLDIGATDDYIRYKRGEVVPVYDYGCYEATKNTFGIMCVAEDSPVVTTHGNRKIQDIQTGESVLTEDGTYQKVLAVIPRGEKETVCINTSFGEPLRCTADHRVLTQYGWVEAGKLDPKIHLVKAYWSEPRNTDLGNMKDWCLGLYLANGSSVSYPASIACRNREDAETVKKIFDSEFNLSSVVYHNVRCWYVRLVSVNRYNGRFSRNYRPNEFNKYLKDYGLKGANVYQKRMPESPSLMLLAGLIEGDGCIANQRVRLCNQGLAKDLYRGLQAHRIPGAYNETVENGKTVFEVSFNEHPYPMLPFVLKEKRCLDKKRSSGTLVPTYYLETVQAGILPKSVKSNIRRMITMRHKTYRQTVEKYGGYCEHPLWANVLSIRKDRHARTWDLSIDRNHSFCVGGLIVHNCYQEQFMSIAHTLGGFDLGKTDVLRKCVDGDSLFWTEQGYVRIKDLKSGSGVHVISPTESISKYNKVDRVLLPRTKECVRITTRSGKELVCTGDHRILTNKGWVEVRDSKGAFVIRDLVEKYGTYSEDWRKTYITVALITEGTCASSDCCMAFTNKDETKINLFISCIESYLGCNDYKIYCDKKGVMRITVNHKYLDDIHVKSVKSEAHELPFEYLSFNKYELLRCLGWMIDFDGFILSKNGNIYYSSKSHKLIHQVQYLFDNIGVKSNIIKKYNKQYDEYYYEIYVTDHKDNKRLHEMLRDYSQKVAEFNFGERIRITASNFSLYQVPYNVWYSTISQLIRNSGYSKNELMGTNIMSNIKKNVPLTHERLSKILQVCGRNKWLEFVADNNVFYDEVVSIEAVGERVVYDFKMMDGVQPLACVNGMIVHNCIGKKKIDLMATLKMDFITGAIANGCPDYEAEEIWHKIEVAGKYSFNRSHAAAYALTAYAGAWLKANYPSAFYTIALQWADDKEVPFLMSEMELCSSAHIVPPDINRSGITFFTDYKTDEIFWSLNRIKMVGGKAAKYIVDERQRNGDYTSIENFIHRIFRYKLKRYEYWDDPDNQEETVRVPVNARHVKHLVLTGCLDQTEGVKAVTERYAILERAARELGFALQEKDFPLELRDKHYFWSQQQVVLSGVGSIDYRRVFDNSEARQQVKGKASYMTLRDALSDENEGKRITICATVTEVSESSYKDKTTGEKKRFGKLMLQQNNDLMECVCWNDFYMAHRTEVGTLKDQVVILTAVIRYSDYKGANGLQTYKTSLIYKV